MAFNISKYRKEYYAKNRTKNLAYSKAYQLAHPEKSRKRALRYKKAHPEKVRAMEVRYRKLHGDKVRAASLSWRNRNLEKARANEKRWRLAHPEYSVAKSFKRCALKRTSKINLAAINEFIRSIKTKPRAICYYCEKNIPTKGCHFDHIVPLSKGGPHEISNICVSCASCNHSKHNKSIGAWIRIGQQVLNL